MDLNKLEQKVEKLTDQIKALNFEFKNIELGREAEDIIEDIADLLEGYLELATEDVEGIEEED